MHVKAILVDHWYALTIKTSLLYMVLFHGVVFVQNPNHLVYILEFTGFTSGGISGQLKINFSYYNWIYGVTRYTRSMEYKIEQDPETGNFITDTFNKIKDAFNSAGTTTGNFTGLIFMLFLVLFY